MLLCDKLFYITMQASIFYLYIGLYRYRSFRNVLEDLIVNYKLVQNKMYLRESWPSPYTFMRWENRCVI